MIFRRRHHNLPLKGDTRVPPELLRNSKIPESVLEKLFGVSRAIAPPAPQLRHDPLAPTDETARARRRPLTRKLNSPCWQDGRDPRLEHEKAREATVAKSNLDKLLTEGGTYNLHVHFCTFLSSATIRRQRHLKSPLENLHMN